MRHAVPLKRYDLLSKTLAYQGHDMLCRCPTKQSLLRPPMPCKTFITSSFFANVVICAAGPCYAYEVFRAAIDEICCATPMLYIRFTVRSHAYAKRHLTVHYQSAASLCSAVPTFRYTDLFNAITRLSYSMPMLLKTSRFAALPMLCFSKQSMPT